MRRFACPPCAVQRVAAVAAPAAVLHLAVPSATAPLAATAFTVALRAAHNRRANDRGVKPKALSFEARAARLAGRTPEEKLGEREREDQAAALINMELPDDLQALQDKYVDEAKALLVKMANPAVALERLTIDVAPGVSRPLLQLATVTKTSAKTLQLAPHDKTRISLLMQRLVRHDHSLVPSRVGDKISVTIEPVTREKRERCVAEITELIDDYRAKLKAHQSAATHALAELKLRDINLMTQYKNALIDTVRTATEDALAALQDIQDEAMATEDDNSDV